MASKSFKLNWNSMSELLMKQHNCCFFCLFCFLHTKMYFIWQKKGKTHTFLRASHRSLNFWDEFFLMPKKSMDTLLQLILERFSIHFVFVVQKERFLIYEDTPIVSKKLLRITSDFWYLKLLLLILYIIDLILKYGNSSTLSILFHEGWRKRNWFDKDQHSIK